MLAAFAAMALLNTSRGCTRIVSSVPSEIFAARISRLRVLSSSAWNCSVSSSRFFARTSRTTFSGLSSTGDSSCNSFAIFCASANAATSVTALSRPMPFTFFKNIHRRQSERLQRAEFLHQLLADLHGVRALETGAQQDGDQLRVAQRLSAERHEPFARSLARGLILESHRVGHGKGIPTKHALVTSKRVKEATKELIDFAHTTH